LQFFIESALSAFELIVSFDPEVYFIIWTSLRVALVALLFAALAGVPMGLLIALNRFTGKQAVLLVLNTLMALPTVVVGLFFYALLRRRGPLGTLELLFTPNGLSLGLFALALPLVLHLTIAAIEDLDPRIVITCKGLGATPRQTAWKVLQEARFAVTSALVIAFGRVISEVGIAMMLGGNIRGFTRTMTTAIALETSKGEFVLGLALGFVLMAVAFGVNALLFLLQRRR